MGESLSRTDYLFLQEFLRERIGHELGEGKEYLVMSRLGPVAESTNLASVASLFEVLRSKRYFALENSVCEAMLTCETSFFRNPSAFERLRLTVLPELLERRRAERRLRIWSAGCSTGQEAYSIAMLLLENFPEVRFWDVKILGTDLAERVLESARRGEYSQSEVGRGLPDSYLKTYFASRKHRWALDASVTQLVKFEKQNLLSLYQLNEEFDVIFIRNVLIYFATEPRIRIFQGLRRMIRDDGYLFLGESETIIGQGEDFRFAEAGMDFYRPTLR